MKQKVINMKVKNKNMGAWMREQTWVHAWVHGIMDALHSSNRTLTKNT